MRELACVRFVCGANLASFTYRHFTIICIIPLQRIKTMRFTAAVAETADTFTHRYKEDEQEHKSICALVQFSVKLSPFLSVFVSYTFVFFSRLIALK